MADGPAGSTDVDAIDPAEFVARLAYKPGWTFKVAGPLGSMLCVFATTPDSWHPERERCTQHQFTIPVPCDSQSFSRWVFDRLLECELHEAGEFFAVGGHRPFYPNHQDEGSPYVIVERPAPNPEEQSCQHQ